MKKENWIFYITIGILLLCLAGSLFVLWKNNAHSTEMPIESDTNLKVVSQVKLKTWTTGGAIVTMDDSSSFGQLNVFVPKEYLDNKYVGGDYLSIYHNGVIKDGTVAEFEKIYSVDTYHIESTSLYNEWDINTSVNLDDPTFKELVWPAIVKNYPGAENDIKAISVLAASRSYNPIYAVLCSVNHGEDKNSLSVYYVQVAEGKGVVVLSESLLVSLDRLTQDSTNS